MTRRGRLLIWVLVAALATPAFAHTVPAAADDLENELAEVEAEIESLLADIDDAGTERTELVGRISATQARIDALREDLAIAQQALDDATWQLNLERVKLDQARAAVVDAQVALAEAQRAVTDGRAAAEEAVRELYMGSGQETPGVVLTSDSIGNAVLKVAYLDRLSEHTAAAVTRFESYRVVAESRKAAVEVREADVEAQVELLGLVERTRADHAETVSARAEEVAAELGVQRSLLRQVDEELAFFETELAGLEDEQAELEALIAAETSGGGSGGETGTGLYVRPVPGPITSPFGPRLHPILGYVRMHTGVDMTAPHGQEIRAMTGGRVILASSYGGYGNAVIIDHGGGMTTLYAHQSSVGVSYGDTVEAGEVIGYVGSTGLATGPHLHFEVRISGSPVDPAPYLAGT